MSNSILRFAALLALVHFGAAAHAGGSYTFTKLVDDVGGDFGPRTFTSASINTTGEVAFKGTRSAPDGLSSWDVIARVDRTGAVTTIVEDPDRLVFQFFSNFVSINDSGAIA